MTREALLQEALRLPRRERADVAAELLASLDDELTDAIELPPRRKLTVVP